MAETDQSGSLDRSAGAPVPDPAAVAASAKQLSPPDQIRVVQEVMSAVWMQGPMPNPIHQKITPDHITAALAIASDHDAREHDLLKGEQSYESSNRWFGILVLVIIIATAITICIIFKNNPAVLTPILTGLFGFGAGALGGYGYGKSKG